MVHQKHVSEALNEKFGINGALRFENRRGERVSAILHDVSGSSCELSLYGAHVLDWCTPNGSPLLFLSNRAVFAPGKPIRGGIPLVFPQFGNGALPAHGFARIGQWEVDRTERHADGSIEIVLSYQGAPEYESLWPHDSLAEYSVRLGATLQSTLKVTNRGSSSFSFQAAFHTYYSVADITSVRVFPFMGAEYLDSLRERARAREERAHIAFEAQTDRIYLNHTAPVTIEDPAGKRSFSITTKGTRDEVVWNPWMERTAQISDLAPDDWRRFVCVEPGIVHEPMTVQPDGSHTLSQEIRASSR